MGAKPTFHLADDYVAMMELKPAERTVYMLLRCNASFGRNGVANHTVHVTGGWFTEMTAHWENPMPASTARRGINGLIEKGVLIRLNEPQDGSGFVLAFVADPRGRVEGPVNGFDQAKKVAKRCGVRAYYERRDDMPGLPAVTGVRLNAPKSKWSRAFKSEDPEPAPEPKGEETPAEEPREPYRENGEPDGTGTPSQGSEDFDMPDAEAQGLTPAMEELADALERKTARLNVPGHRLTRNQCRLVAQECGGALALGWDPAVLAQRMVSQMGPKIHTPMKFLPKKAAELGAPPPLRPLPAEPHRATPGPTRSSTPAPAPTPAPASGSGKADSDAIGGLAMQKLQQFWEQQQLKRNAGRDG